MGQQLPRGPIDIPVEDRNPIDVVERIAGNRRYLYERNAECELTILSGGDWVDHRLCFNYLVDCEALQLTLMFEPRIPDRRLTEIFRLVARMNATTWLGHFDLWDEEQMVLFRYGMPLRDTRLIPAQCEDVIDLALEACNNFFPALQYVLWAGMDADDAVNACMFATTGEA